MLLPVPVRLLLCGRMCAVELIVLDENWKGVVLVWCGCQSAVGGLRLAYVSV